MRYATAEAGRVLVVRLEDGDAVHECIQEAVRRPDPATGFELLEV